MLELTVYDGDRKVDLRFEHSLLSLSKWEEKHKKAFLGPDQHAPTEMLDYWSCMLLPPEDDPNLVVLLSPDQGDQLLHYINEERTASSIPDDGKRKSDGEVVTSELIYFWLVALRIPFQPTETWHLSRTLMLVQITGYKQQPPKKRKATEVMSDWIRINNERREKFHTNG